MGALDFMPLCELLFMTCFVIINYILASWIGIPYCGWWDWLCVMSSSYDSVYFLDDKTIPCLSFRV